MPFALDADIARIIGVESGPPKPAESSVARDDWQTLRATGEELMSAVDASLPDHSTVAREDFAVNSYDGTQLPVRWYIPEGHGSSSDGSAVVYLHGGGMILGSVQRCDRYVAGHVAESGVPVLSVDYRRAPEDPYPTPVEDCYAALAWLAAHADELSVNADRLALMGDSGGGGLAAATALLARDRELPVAKQILIYPMLDDRTTTPDPALEPFAFWTYDNNHTGWHALLGDAIGTSEVPATAAPARARDLSGLPSAFIEVGELDIFRDECIEFARRLASAGTSVELHVHPGCPHGYDRVDPSIPVAQRSRADRLRVLRSL